MIVPTLLCIVKFYQRITHKVSVILYSYMLHEVTFVNSEEVSTVTLSHKNSLVLTMPAQFLCSILVDERDKVKTTRLKIHKLGVQVSSEELKYLLAEIKTDIRQMGY